MKKRIVIAGGTGLVGQQVVSELVGLDGINVHMLLRPLSGTPILGVSQHVGDPANWPDIIDELRPDVVVSCLGTTMKQAGSQDAFRAVDHDLVLAVARSARLTGARQMIAVSSVGASSQSSNFYLKTKGEVEDMLRAMDFERLDIIRPGLLTGGKRKDYRPGESLGIMLAPLTDLLMLGSLSKYASSPSIKVAQAIVSLALAGGHGRFIHENLSIKALAG
jgi:uncharacterized protein YbjT (DUF2867 family)